MGLYGVGGDNPFFFFFCYHVDGWIGVGISSGPVTVSGEKRRRIFSSRKSGEDWVYDSMTWVSRDITLGI